MTAVAICGWFVGCSKDVVELIDALFTYEGLLNLALVLSRDEREAALRIYAGA